MTWVRRTLARNKCNGRSAQQDRLAALPALKLPFYLLPPESWTVTGTAQGNPNRTHFRGSLLFQ